MNPQIASRVGRKGEGQGCSASGTSASSVVIGGNGYRYKPTGECSCELGPTAIWIFVLMLSVEGVSNIEGGEIEPAEASGGTGLEAPDLGRESNGFGSLEPIAKVRDWGTGVGEDLSTPIGRLKHVLT